MQEANVPDRVVRSTRAAALAFTVALIALCLGWELAWAPTGRGTLALKVLPLVLCLPGLWRHRMYTYRALSLLLWLYVLEGLVRATSEPWPGAGLAVAEVVLALGSFIAGGVYIRRRLRNGARLQAAASLASAPNAS